MLRACRPTLTKFGPVTSRFAFHTLVGCALSFSIVQAYNSRLVLTLVVIAFVMLKKLDAVRQWLFTEAPPAALSFVSVDMAVTTTSSRTHSYDAVVFGLGYVGLTLAVSLARSGVRVAGYDTNPRVATSLRAGHPHFQERGLLHTFTKVVGRGLDILEELPTVLPEIVIVCVGTPVNPENGEPDLSQFKSALALIAGRLTAEALVIVRSTVPVGTCRQFALPILSETIANPHIAFCPERTIQGQALDELRRLPQIVGGIDAGSRSRASSFLKRVVPEVVEVSSLEAAEMIKLINNAHTDVIYAFGNEVALLAEAFGLNAGELIASANHNYPRPDLARPGFVGGSCLSKDPHLLIHAARKKGVVPRIIADARQLNAALPIAVAERVKRAITCSRSQIKGSKILISGIAYKGQPETDDVRGSPALPIAEIFAREGATVFAHDFAVPETAITSYGLHPTDLVEGFHDADAVLILNNHSRYRSLDTTKLVNSMRTPSVLYDAWGALGLLPKRLGVQAMGLGHG